MSVNVRCLCSGSRCRLPEGDERHGTANGYMNLKCRCEACRAASTFYLQQCKEARIARGVPEHVHGSAGGYGNWNCRCRPCKDAWSADTCERARRARRGLTLCATGQRAKPKRRSRADTAYAPVAGDSQ